MVGDWHGSAVRFSKAIAEISAADADNVAVILQSGSVETPGAIRGAASIALDKPTLVRADPEATSGKIARALWRGGG
jgi:hypothetical protein